MTDLEPNQVAALFSKTAQLLKRLSPQELSSLVEGSGRLAYLPPGAKIDAPKDMSGTAQTFKGLSAREEGVALFKKLRLKKTELQLLARELQISVSNNGTIAVLQHKVIEGTAGAKEDAGAIRSHSWSQS